MKRIKTILFSFIFLICSFSPCISVYAQGSEWTASEKTRFFAEGFYKIVTDIVGLILPTGLGGQDLQNDYKNYVLNNDWIQNNLTYDEWIASQISGAYINGSSGNSNVTFSADLQNSLNVWANDWITNNGGFIYGYSFPVSSTSLSALFNNQSDYDAIVSFFSSHSDSYIVMGNPSGGNYVFWEYSEPLYFVKSSIDSSSRIECYPYLYLNNSYVVANANNSNGHVNTYKLDQSTHSIISASVNRGVYVYLSESPNSVNNLLYYGPIADSNIEQYIVYNSLPALQSTTPGVQTYYITDIYNSNTDNSVTNDYSTTTSNINNTISYNNIADYVNNYYVENNSYPTTNNVYNYINNYVPPNDDNGGDDNGGGGDFDWSFLGTIGEFLGGLISAVGNVLSGILSALTDVIDMFIGENGLPNVIGQLVNYFLPFLPEWVPNLIGLSVILALILGVIKLIRG